LFDAYEAGDNKELLKERTISISISNHHKNNRPMVGPTIAQK